MTTLTLYSIDNVIGGAFGTLIWAIQTAGAILGGLLALILLSILNRDNKLPDNG